jgi:hypothetical protein
MSDRPSANTTIWRGFWSIAIGAFLGSLFFDLMKALVLELMK